MNAPIRRQATPAGRARGFTLVEVLVALAVVALSLGAGMRAASALTDNAQRLHEVMLAQWCADNEMTALRLSKTFPGTSERDFSCDQLGRHFNGKLIAQVHPVQKRFSTVRSAVYDEQGRLLVQLSGIVGQN